MKTLRERYPDADVVRHGDSYFVRPEGPGTDVGPFGTEADAWDWLAEIRPEGEGEVGAVRCLTCGTRYKEAPPGWDCTACGGPVSQHAGTIHVGRGEPRADEVKP